MIEIENDLNKTMDNIINFQLQQSKVMIEQSARPK